MDGADKGILEAKAPGFDADVGGYIFEFPESSEHMNIITLPDSSCNAGCFHAVLHINDGVGPIHVNQ